MPLQQLWVAVPVLNRRHMFKLRLRRVLNGYTRDSEWLGILQELCHVRRCGACHGTPASMNGAAVVHCRSRKTGLKSP